MGDMSWSAGDFYIENFTGNLNTGNVGHDQEMYSALSRRSAQDRRQTTDEYVRYLSPEILRNASQTFVPPENFKKMTRVAESGVVMLVDRKGAGVRTVALKLLHDHVDGGEVHHLLGDFNFRSWRPSRHGVRGFLAEGTLGGMVMEPLALDFLAGELKKAGGLLVVVLPLKDELAVKRSNSSKFTPIRCMPPSGVSVLRAHCAVRLGDRAEADRFIDELPAGFLDNLLAPGSTPGAALEVLEILVSFRESGTLSADPASYVLGELTAMAEADISDRFDSVVLNARELGYIVAAAAFSGEGEHVISTLAERLFDEIKKSRNSVSGNIDESIRLEFYEHFGLRKEVIHSPGQAPSTRVLFARPMWTLAILRYVWRKAGIDRAMARWLHGVDDDWLAERAGWALAQSAASKPGTGMLRDVRACAVVDGSTPCAVASAALRTLLPNPETARDAIGLLNLWASSNRIAYRHTVALACGSQTGAAPVRLALPILRRLIVASEIYPNIAVDRAVDEAMLAVFLHGDRSAYLEQLVSWPRSDGAESMYIARIVPRLLLQESSWFEYCSNDSDTFEIIADVITLAIRARENGRLLDVVRRWRRSAIGDQSRLETIDALLFAVEEDPHPNIRRFMRSLGSHE